MSLIDLNSPKRVVLDIEKFSLIDQLDDISSFDGLSSGNNSREILLFRYPVKKPVNI